LADEFTLIEPRCNDVTGRYLARFRDDFADMILRDTISSAEDFQWAERFQLRCHGGDGRLFSLELIPYRAHRP
jgi:hypothetical protein